MGGSFIAKRRVRPPEPFRGVGVKSGEGEESLSREELNRLSRLVDVLCGVRGVVGGRTKSREDEAGSDVERAEEGPTRGNRNAPAMIGCADREMDGSSEGREQSCGQIPEVTEVDFSAHSAASVSLLSLSCLEYAAEDVVG